MRKFVLLIIAIFFRIFAENNSYYDFAKVHISGMTGIKSYGMFENSDSNIANLWIYSQLPEIKIGKIKLYTALETDIVRRGVSVEMFGRESAIMQRYGFFSGITVVRREKSTGEIFAGAGISSSMKSVTSNDFYANIIYDHRFILSDKLTLGVGILFSYNLGGVKKPIPVNILPTIKWNPSSKFKLDAEWDHIDMLLNMVKRTAFVGTIRYDYSFFNLEKFSYQFETVSGGGGVNFTIAKIIDLRLRLLKTFVLIESAWHGDSMFEESYDVNHSGIVFKLELVYMKRY